MTHDSARDNVARKRLAVLMERFQKASGGSQRRDA
jgi:hypothetical protein